MRRARIAGNLAMWAGLMVVWPVCAITCYVVIVGAPLSPGFWE